MRYSKILVVTAFIAFLAPSYSFAASGTGGACPKAAKYLDPSTNNQQDTLSNLGVTSCFYIAANGADSNSGTTESSPWAHAPGMATCTGNCATVIPSPGTGFIFRGRDTWGPANFMIVTHGGSSGSPVYYGVDQSWYSGSSWNRPIFNANSTQPNAVSQSSVWINLKADYITFDDFEFINFACSASPQIMMTIIARNGHTGINDLDNYFHAFSSPTGGCGSAHLNGDAVMVNVDESVPLMTGGWFSHNVVDGSDGSGARGYFTDVVDVNSSENITYNVVHDICSAFGGDFSLAHDNLIYNFGDAVGQVSTCNSVAAFHPHAIRTSQDADIYNNVIHDAAGEVIMVNPNSTPSHPVSNIYNNVLYHNLPFAIETGDQGSNVNGVLNVFNNTIDCDSDGGYGSCLILGQNLQTLTIKNEHHIYTSGAGLGGIVVDNAPFRNSGGAGAVSLDYSGPTSQICQSGYDDCFETMAQANAKGYNALTAIEYEPTLATAPTIGIGVVGVAPGEDEATTYACTQSTVNGVVVAQCPGLQPVRRGLSGPCTAGTAGCVDAGAFEYVSGLGAPNSLTGTVVAQ